MAKGIQDKLSLCAVFLRFFFNGTLLATGSGFVWKHDARLFLISNWHNFTGRDPLTRRPLDGETGGVPNRVEGYFWKDKLEDGQRLPGLASEMISFPLTGEQIDEPLFHEHKIFGSRVDIAALQITLPNHIVSFVLNEQSFEERLSFSPGQDVFIIGYPLGLLTGNTLPIWKRGTIASEPYVPIDGLRKVLIDTASRKGMSGSFVIAQHTGVFVSSPEGMLPDDWFGTDRKLLGVYSGRLSPSDVEAQLGIVWARELIDGITANGCPPSV